MVIESASTAGAGLRRPIWRRLISHRDLHFGAVGLLAYSYVIRFRGLLPTNVTWIFRDATGDVAGFDSTANYLGWEFFRRGDYLTWPIGRSTLLGPEPGASIAMSDSLPLLGIPMKYLTWWTDRPLQYFGMWILICFVLQTIFAGRILQKFISSHTTVLVAASVFPLMPFYLARVGVHTPISGHWIVLAAITLLLSDRLSWWRWSVVVAGAIAIQPYLGAMVLVTFVCTAIGTAIAAKRWTWHLTALSISVFVTAVVAAHQVGLFVFGGGSLSTAGVGDFTANVASIVDSRSDTDLMFTPDWSRFAVFPNLIDGTYQYEGFGYVGGGLLLFAIVVSFAQLFSSRKGVIVFGVALATATATYFELPVLSVIALGALLITVLYFIRKEIRNTAQQIAILLIVVFAPLLAVSNRVAIGGREFKYPWPDIAIDLLGVFRVTGRFIWILGYIAAIAVTVMISRLTKSHRWMLAVMTVMVLIQVAEISVGVYAQRLLLTGNKGMPGIESELWDVIGDRYSRIEIVLPTNHPGLGNPGPKEDQEGLNEDFWYARRALWADLGEFAVYRGISLNAFYFGRDPSRLNAREGAKLREIVQSNGYRDDTLYVFTDSALWNQAKTVRRSQDVVGLLDGIPIVAPNLRECSACPLDDVSPVRPVGG